MHPRNRFKEQKPDFGAYLKTRKSLEKYLIKRKQPSAEGFLYTLDFSDSNALRELTCACLKHDFDLDVTIALDRLIPAVPQRLNYIHWVEDLLSIDKGEIPQGHNVIGIDIGTGASCIYPLLGTRLNGWRFIATEIDKDSFKCALSNVSANRLSNNISVQLVSSDTLLVGVVEKDISYDFCMCNPPFFKDREEMLGLSTSRTGHRPIPHTQNTGNETETITEGGEIEFVKRIISDSLKLGTRIRWYSSMVGRKSSIKVLKSELEGHKVPVITTTEFCQGKTHRWAIAWSFEEHLMTKMKLVLPGMKRGRAITLPLRGLSADMEGVTKAFEEVKKILDELKINYKEVSRQDEEGGVCLLCSTVTNTWSHQRKRRRLKERLRSIRGERGLTGDQTTGGKEEKMIGLPPEEEGPLATSRSSEKDVLDQFQALCVPCSIKFECSILINNSNRSRKDSPTTSKRLRMEMDDISFATEISLGESGGRLPQNYSDECVTVSLEWVSGENKDHLHQIMQYLKNNIDDNLKDDQPQNT